MQIYCLKAKKTMCAVCQIVCLIVFLAEKYFVTSAVISSAIKIQLVSCPEYGISVLKKSKTQLLACLQDSGPFHCTPLGKYSLSFELQNIPLIKFETGK